MSPSTGSRGHGCLRAAEGAMWRFSKQPRRLEKLGQPTVDFLGEQDGSPERDLKERLAAWNALTRMAKLPAGSTSTEPQPWADMRSGSGPARSSREAATRSRTNRTRAPSYSTWTDCHGAVSEHGGCLAMTQADTMQAAAGGTVERQAACERAWAEIGSISAGCSFSSRVGLAQLE